MPGPAYEGNDWGAFTSSQPGSLPSETALSNEASVRSVADVGLSVRIDLVSSQGAGGVSATSAKIQAASAAATSANAHANTVSARAVSISSELASLIASGDAFLSARITSVEGLPGTSVTSAKVATASAAATSADLHANTVSARIVSASAELGSLIQIASAAATSADTHANSVSVRATSISNELGSLLASVSAQMTSIVNVVSAQVLSAVAKRAINTAAQASITVSTGLTISGVSIALVAGQTYSFEFQIPFTCLLPSGVVVAVVSPAANQYCAHYQIPGAVANAGLLPAANAVTPFEAEVRAVNTKVSTTSITLTNTTLMARAWGFINPSSGGSIKFVIGPNVSGGANSGVIVLQGANVRVWRVA